MSTRPRIDKIAVPPGTSQGQIPMYDEATDRLLMGAPVSPFDNLLLTEVDGVPGFVFDDDGSIVYTEAP